MSEWREWPKLDRPAQVGSSVFMPGVSARLVVDAAQRMYEYAKEEADEATSEQWREIERNCRAIWDMVNGPLEDDDNGHR